MFDAVFSTMFLAAIIRVSTPILLAAVGGLLSETAGVPNITLEGSMLSGACAGALVCGYSGSPWLGLLAAIVAGMLPGLILGCSTSSSGPTRSSSGSGSTCCARD